MGTKGGIWLDQKGAWLVTVEPEDAVVEFIESKVEDLSRSTGGVRGSRPFVHRSANSAVHNEKRHDNELHTFFVALTSRIKDFDRLLILGSGPVKEAFAAHLEGAGLRERVDGVVKCRRLSENQLTAKVKSWFGYEPARGFTRDQHA